MNRRGFSLLEVLVATALTGLVLVGLYTLMFSMTELWGSTHPQRQFEQHMENLTHYLSQALRSSALPPFGTTTSISPYTWTIPNSGGGSTGGAAGNSPLLTFTLPTGSRLLPWPPEPTGGSNVAGAGSTTLDGRALPDVQCSLQVRQGEGLILLWHSQYETTFTTDPPRETLISPLVTDMYFDYYDSTNQQWTSQDTPLADPSNSNSYLPPTRLRLIFTYGSLSQSSTIPLLTATQGLPYF